MVFLECKCLPFAESLGYQHTNSIAAVAILKQHRVVVDCRRVFRVVCFKVVLAVFLGVLGFEELDILPYSSATFRSVIIA